MYKRTKTLNLISSHLLWKQQAFNMSAIFHNISLFYPGKKECTKILIYLLQIFIYTLYTYVSVLKVLYFHMLCLYVLYLKYSL